MTFLKPGDVIVCAIKENRLVNAYSDFDYLKQFEIIATVGGGYYIYIRDYDGIKGGFVLDAMACKKMNILPSFIGEQTIHITPNYVFKVKEFLDGMKCDRCGDFCHQAQPNQPNDVFVCYSCRTNPYR